jgi:hypothetical protein
MTSDEVDKADLRGHERREIRLILYLCVLLYLPAMV